jgi:hypothetical protein
VQTKFSHGKNNTNFPPPFKSTKPFLIGSKELEI